jgi:hypothetical protein
MAELAPSKAAPRTAPRDWAALVRSNAEPHDAGPSHYLAASTFSIVYSKQPQAAFLH